MNAKTPTRPARLRGDRVTMAHGGGGKAMRDLIEEIFTDVFQPPGNEDQARLTTQALAEPGARLAFTTDSFVVSPPVFPGGDIGKIAVCGTVNDLAVGGQNLCGCRPHSLSKRGALLICFGRLWPPCRPRLTRPGCVS